MAQDVVHCWAHKEMGISLILFLLCNVIITIYIYIYIQVYTKEWCGFNSEYYLNRTILLCMPCIYTEYTQKNGAVSMVNKGKPHHSFVYTLYINKCTHSIYIYELFYTFQR
jgi:hypothetical protein